MQINESSIIVDSINKSFRLPHEKVDSVKGLFLGLFRGRRTFEEQQVLKNISLEVQKGEFLGIVGRNGSGKSTLLKLLAGIYVPDSGEISVNGRLTPFIELGVGFNPDLTGRENVYLNGALLGFSKKQMADRYDDIVKFAELKKFMDQKLKNYSSGMQVRLAFSIAIQVDSDILLIDEVLAVGDSKFQKKCFKIFENYKQSGKTVVFVSHSMEQIKKYCDRVIVIHDGEKIFSGNPAKGAQVYEKLNKVNVKNIQNKPTAKDVSYRTGNKKVKITEAKLNKTKVKPNDEISFTAAYRANDEVENAYFGLSVYRKDRVQSVFALSGKVNLSEERITITIPELFLNPGNYHVSFGLTNKQDNWKNPYDLMEKSFTFIVKEDASLSKYKSLAPGRMDFEVKDGN